MNDNKKKDSKLDSNEPQSAVNCEFQSCIHEMRIIYISSLFYMALMTTFLIKCVYCKGMTPMNDTKKREKYRWMI